MSLHLQLISIFFSILYGLFSSYVLKKARKYIYEVSKIYVIFDSFLLMINLTLIYFVFMYKINSGNIKILFIAITILTVLIINYCNLQKKCKNKSNRL